MPYCKLCDEFVHEHSLREADRALSEMIRTSLRKLSFIQCDKICMQCIENKLQVCAKRNGKTLVIGTKSVCIQHESNSKLNDANGPSSPRSAVNSTKLTLYLIYKQGMTSFEEVRSQFMPNSTVEAVMNCLIKALDLKVSLYNLILTTAQSNDKKIRHINVLASPQTLSALDIENGTHLRFEYSDNPTENNDRGSNWSSASDSSYYVTVNYLKTEETQKHWFNRDGTIGALLSFIVKKFDLKNVDRSCLQLSSNDIVFDTTNSEKTLVSLDVGTKYSVLDLDVKSPRKSQRITTEVSNPPDHVVVKCYFAPQEVTIDLSTARTVKDLKQQIIDKLEAQNNCSLKVDRVNLKRDGIPFEGTDDHRLLKEFNFKSNSKLEIDFSIRSNENLTNSTIKNEASIGRNDSSPKTETRAALSLVSITVPKQPSPVGLRNLGNTCYMNSALQCLSHVPTLTCFFLNTIMKEQTVQNNNSNPFESYGEVTSSYAKFIWNMWKGQRSSFSPNEIREAIGKIDPRFATYDQQDAHEFITFLLNTMHNEMTEKNNDLIKKLFYGTIKSTTTCLKCKKPKVTSNVISFLTVPLVQCKRSFTVHYIPHDNTREEDIVVDVIASGRIEDLLYVFSKQRSLDRHRLYALPHDNTNEQLTLEKPLSEILEHEVTICDEGYDRNKSYNPSPRYEDGLTLKDCIREFLALESIENTRFCKEHCNALTHTVKQMQLYSLPPVLIIQLKRFTNENGYRRKLDTFVRYPLNELNLNDLLPGKHSCSKNAVYDLLAISNHSGSIHGGHYTAYARQDINDPWYEFNDTSVRIINSNDTIVSRNAYLLIYLRREKNNTE